MVFWFLSLYIFLGIILGLFFPVVDFGLTVTCDVRIGRIWRRPCKQSAGRVYLLDILETQSEVVNILLFTLRIKFQIFFQKIILWVKWGSSMYI